MDIVYVAVVIFFFGLSLGFVALCERMLTPKANGGKK
jgi:hypothetical protein